MQTVGSPTPAFLSVLILIGAISVFAVLLDRPLEAGMSEGLDTACIARIRRPESEVAEVTVARTYLERLAGAYVQKEMDLEIQVEPLDHRMRVTFTKGAPFPPSLLIPISPTCFKLEGKDLAPGLTVVFHLEGEKASELTVVQPDKPEVVLRRKS